MSHSADEGRSFSGSTVSNRFDPEAIARIREQAERCEAEGIRLPCCPEAVLGGLADYAHRPAGTALDAEAGELDDVLAPLATVGVASIIGFTETDRQGRLFNAAAVYDEGRVLGVYRKHHPAKGTPA